LGRYRPGVGSATLFGMDERYPSQSSFAPGNTGAPGGYGAPGPSGAYGAPGAYGQAAYDAEGYPAGGYGQPPYGAPGFPPGFPPELIPPGYNPWLGVHAGPRYASVWLRIAAYLIDGLVLGVVNAVAYLTVIAMTASAGGSGNESAALTAMLAALVLVIVLDGIYFVAQEGTSGQTLGKRVVGTKVVKADGSEMSVEAAFIRYFFLLLASFAVGGLLTVLMVALSDTKQRIGDRVAGTIVVKAG